MDVDYGNNRAKNGSGTFVSSLDEYHQVVSVEILYTLIVDNYDDGHILQ